MALRTLQVSPGFMRFMPKEYQDLVEKGPFGRKLKLSDLGTYKELLEEHPMCEGCAMAFFIRLALTALPAPEHTVIVGTAGCGRLSLSQAAIPFVYGNYCDTNGVATGIKRGLALRFPDQPKDVVVIAGDGGLSDIGFSQVMHGWFRQEKFTTVMLDNEVYGNTGGQESGMTKRGEVVKMAPIGKQFEKIDMIGLAKTAGVAYIARLTPTNPSRIISTIRKAVLIAREVGPTYVQAYTSCNIEYSIPPEKVLEDARQVEKERYGFLEIISDEAKAFLAAQDAAHRE
ncbi:MAG: Oxalate oxidoreductase subunit beta [Firmicutes bacterium]|nr:Oxalate oxidoreductase subunit beta [candidate division NPL-UPA2 bacterium]MBT9153893.1 Oxalate oxidoreductase subunit beta [candidate division NPL-UPA2 bacterium]MBT9155592.1 Oxalate oxidoreductase subunit beta [candidate division NPL-UPA2 bacterium]